MGDAAAAAWPDLKGWCSRVFSRGVGEESFDLSYTLSLSSPWPDPL